jgi:hypothetical protein
MSSKRPYTANSVKPTAIPELPSCDSADARPSAVSPFWMSAHHLRDSSMMSVTQLKQLFPPKGLQALRNVRCRTRGFRFFIWSEILRIFRQPTPLIPHRIWFELQFKPLDALKYYGIPVPGLPPDDVQIRFTGRTGRDNLMQAFSFYQYICSVCQLNKINLPKVLDFGGGWGRIARFFLRDTKPEMITIADCLSDSTVVADDEQPLHYHQKRPFPTDCWP